MYTVFQVYKYILIIVRGSSTLKVFCHDIRVDCSILTNADITAPLMIEIRHGLFNQRWKFKVDHIASAIHIIILILHLSVTSVMSVMSVRAGGHGKPFDPT